jgi:glutamyl-tRNA synthetase
MEESGLKFGKIGPSVRAALVGGTVSPSIYDVVAVLGRGAVLERLNKALASIG